jgi:hypothetical protein
LPIAFIQFIVAKLPPTALASHPYYLLIRFIQHGTNLCYNFMVIVLCILKSKTLKATIERELKDYMLYLREQLIK